MQKGSGEKAKGLILNIHKWACLIQILPSYTLNQGCKTQEQNGDFKTQIPLTLKKVQAEFHPPANYMWRAHYSHNLDLSNSLIFFPACNM